jgi:hypothetical protein
MELPKTVTLEPLLVCSTYPSSREAGAWLHGTATGLLGALKRRGRDVRTGGICDTRALNEAETRLEGVYRMRNPDIGSGYRGFRKQNPEKSNSVFDLGRRLKQVAPVYYG